ncbi:NAD(P)/FAD-dependent oxidoreductase [Bradyrhizobium sp. Ai1a-2]|uniref:flavin-containing monooxygenase n=1 Tax=Bradyrhizobium sp. Ai1a-2 TaxID=196490 RepID=UPI001916CBB4|nr:NAD(P)/FAD-dependent oxidoreductase [Bradyrhizobium sp. Ai1a-2]
MTSLELDSQATTVDAVVIGAGPGGIATSVALKRAGVKSFLILERESKIGGVWRDNTYPGAACDVPSFLYSFSFEMNTQWSKVFAPQAEIRDYLERCVEKYGLRRHILCDTEVVRLGFDETTSRWIVTTATGKVIKTSVVLTAVGQLNRPAVPKLSGIETFSGPHFHSARWDHHVELEGKSVAVIGAGASAIQVVPHVAKIAARLTVFQRSPPWVMPKPDRAYSDSEKWRFKWLPLLARASRAKLYWSYERGHDKVIAGTKLNKAMEVTARAIIAKIKDPALRKTVTPDYPLGCKRILLSNEWYPALAQDNVKVTAEGIERVTPTAIVTKDGGKHPVDAIIYCTGFKSTEFLLPMEIVGRDNKRLHDIWKDGAEAYRGSSVPGFPNLFMIYGPNTTVPSSAIFMIECQVNYVIKFVKRILRDELVFEVKREPMRRFNEMIQHRAQRYAWMSSCNNWFKSASGKLVNNWPSPTLKFFLLTRVLDAQNYQITRQSE